MKKSSGRKEMRGLQHKSKKIGGNDKQKLRNSIIRADHGDKEKANAKLKAYGLIS